MSDSFSPSSTENPIQARSSTHYMVAVISLILGLGFGYFLFGLFPANKPAITPIKQELVEIELPSDVVQIQSCANNKGTLYVRPNNIPVGPVYMVYKGKVIGIEFMLDKKELLAGKNYKFLTALGMKTDHVNIGQLSQAHSNSDAEHYHVTMYTVSKEVEDGITCDVSNVEPTKTPITSPVISPDGH